MPKTTSGATRPASHAENFGKNLELVAKIEALAARKGCTAAQVALAWLLAQGEDVVPIPGTKRVKYLEENVAALNVELSADERAEIDSIFPPGSASGERYPDMSFVNR